MSVLPSVEVGAGSAPIGSSRVATVRAAGGVPVRGLSDRSQPCRNGWMVGGKRLQQRFDEGEVAQWELEGP